MMKRLLPILLVAPISLTSNAQQQPTQLPPLTEKVDVSVINVDATVIGPDGAPVSNLTADDFEIVEDGKPQKITNFYAVEHSTVRETSTAAAASSPAPQRFRRKAVLLVDNHFVDKRSRDVALAKVRDFIDASYAGDYDWSIGVIAGGVHVIQPFTSNRDTIRRAIDHMLHVGVAAPVAAAAGSAVSESTAGFGTAAKEDATYSGREAAQQSAGLMIKLDKDIRFKSALDALRASARAVIDACRAFSSVEGKKLIILVTGSMEVDNRVPDLRPDQFANMAVSNASDAVLIRDAMIREANAANFNIYVINAAGVQTPVEGFDVTNGRPDDQILGNVRELDSNAVALASQTGGAYLTSNVIDQSIKKIDQVSATFYSLGYSPKHFEDNKYHRIQVRLKKPGYKVLSRSGYFDTSSDTRLEESLHVAVSSAVPEGDLPVEVSVGKPELRGGKFVVPVTASMPLQKVTTVRQGDRSEGRVHVYLSIFDQTDTNVGFNHAVQQLELTQQQVQELGEAPDSNFRYTMKIELKPGLYLLVVALRDDVSDEVGKAVTVVDTRS